MTNPDWLKELSNEQLKELIESATHLCIERDKKQIAKGYIETIRDYCLAIENLHTDIPTLPTCPKWINLAYDFDELLTHYFS